MKNLYKSLAIIALVAVIGFSFAACGDGDDSGGGSGGGITGTDGNGDDDGTGGGGSWGGGDLPDGYSFTSGWPPTNVRSQYGIGGLNQPPGGSNFGYITVSEIKEGIKYDMITILFTLNNANTTLNHFKNWFNSNGWTLKLSIDYEDMQEEYVWQKMDESVGAGYLASYEPYDNALADHVGDNMAYFSVIKLSADN